VEHHATRFLTINADSVRNYKHIQRSPKSHLKSILSSSEPSGRITAAAWSPNNQRLAIATSDRVIHLFDEMGEQKDKFPTKPADVKVFPIIFYSLI
jgi:hypothetical protein